MRGEEAHIKVIVRARPFNRREMEQSQRCIIKFLDEKNLLFDPEDEDDEFFFQGSKQTHRDITKRVNRKLTMEFDRVFEPSSKNEQIFEESLMPLIDSLLNGYNCSVFVYGATGAGKTFTMLGSSDCLGLTYLTMQHLFDKMQEQSGMRKFDVGISYLEVYNEQVMNLLTKEGPLKLREDTNGVVVSGLALKAIYTADELLQLLALGNCNRTQHPTDANSESSRSHAIFQVHVRMTELSTGLKRTVKLSMIDLAGSERAASTKGIGMRFKEGACINKSLLALGNCINKLADGNKHIPYRDSNLTRILKDSLGGNCRTLMVANISMSSLTFEDTYNTLRYASRAKKIRATVRQNMLTSNMPKDFYIKKVNEATGECERLRQQIKALEAQLAEQNAKNCSIEVKQWQSEIDATYLPIINAQEYVLRRESKIKTLEMLTQQIKKDQQIRNILPMDENAHEQLSKFSTNIESLDRQIEQQNQDLQRWRVKWQDAANDIKKLKREVNNSKCAEILQIYFNAKESELQNQKHKIRLEHVTGINTQLLKSTQKLHDAYKRAVGILHNVYNTGYPDVYRDDFRKHCECLKHFLLDYDDFEEDFKMPDLEYRNVLPAGKKRIRSNNERAMTSKKQCTGFDINSAVTTADETDSGDERYFKLPQAKKGNFNETQVISSTTKCYDNETFNLDNVSFASSGPSSTSTSSTFNINANKNKKQNYINNLLSDQIVKIPIQNKQAAQNALMTSKTFTRQGLLQTVASGVQKANKKFSPNKIRKSPRSVMERVLTNSGNVMKKPSTTTEPIVRTNRAALFRAKK